MARFQFGSRRPSWRRSCLLVIAMHVHNHSLPGRGAVVSDAADLMLTSAACVLCCAVLCRNERARAVTTVFGGLDVGSAVGLLLCGPLIHWCARTRPLPSTAACKLLAAVQRQAGFLLLPCAGGGPGSCCPAMAHIRRRSIGLLPTLHPPPVAPFRAAPGLAGSRCSTYSPCWACCGARRGPCSSRSSRTQVGAGWLCTH